MAVSPSILIATQGLLNGQALAVNSVMTNLFTKVNNNVFITNIQQINNSNYSSSIDNLPAFMKISKSLTDQITARANIIFPGGVNGTKIFISLFNSALSLCSLSSSFYSGINQYQSKNFSDLGIKSTDYKSTSSNNISNLFPTSKTSTELQNSAELFAADLDNFGTAYDFKQPQNFGAKNLTQSLYQQGLTQKNSINSQIISEGYSLENIPSIPDKILLNILSSIEGTDLAQILSLTGTKPLKPLNNLAELVDARNLLRSETLAALNINFNDTESIKKIGNAVLNLGSVMEKNTIQNLLRSTEFQDYNFLDKLNVPLPSDIANILKPQLGVGSGLYDNPTVNDCIGTVAGEAHIEAFKKILNSLVYFESKPYGEDLLLCLTNMVNAIGTGNSSQINTAQSALINSINAFNTAIAADYTAKKILMTANAALNNSSNQMSKELSNMKLLGIDINTVQTAAPGTISILNFSASLHTYGQDTGLLGTAKLLEGCAKNNIYGEALKNCLVEGRNISRSQYVGKKTSSVANQSATDKAQATASLPKLETEYSEAQILAKDGSSEGKLLLKQAKDKLNATKRLSSNNPLI